MGRRPQTGHGVPNEGLFGVSQAIAADGLVYVAGQIARHPDGTPIAERGLAANYAKAVDNLRVLLERLDSGLDRLAHVQVHVTPDIATDLDEIAALHRRHLGAAETSGALVGVASLIHPAYLVEISAIAALREGGGPVKHVVEGTPFERELGFARAVRAGRHVFVSGQLPVDAAGALAGGSDVVAQFEQALANAVDAFAAAGASRDDVVATHLFVSVTPDPEQLRAIAAIHRRLLGEGDNRPTASLIGVASLPLPGALVEISGIAVLEREEGE
ncbi:MAG: RidA family protein [Thermoleophilia bacterium]